MADFIAMTSSNGARISNAEAVRQEIENFYVDPGEGKEMPCVGENDGVAWVGFWCWGWFTVHSYLPDAESDDRYEDVDWDSDATDLILKAIQPYLL